MYQMKQKVKENILLYFFIPNFILEFIFIGVWMYTFQLSFRFPPARANNDTNSLFPRK